MKNIQDKARDLIAKYRVLGILVCLLCLCACSAARNSRLTQKPVDTIHPCPTCSPDIKIDPTETLQYTAVPNSWTAPTGNELVLPSSLYFVTMQKDTSYHGRHFVRLEMDGHTLTPLGPNHIAGEVNGFDISPIDGSIVFAAAGSLWVMNIDGEVTRILTGLPDIETGGSWFRIQSPVWSPDGSRIAYADNGIRIFDVATGNQKGVVESNCHEVPIDIPPCVYGGDWFLDPLWSSDSQAILLRHQTADYPYGEIFILGKDEAPRALECGSNYVTWSRNGKYLLCAKNTENGRAMVRLSRDGLDRQTLWLLGAHYHPPYAFELPNGHILYFDERALYEAVPGNDGFETNLLHENALLGRPFWHSNGEYVAFLTRTGSQWDLLIMQVETGDVFLVNTTDDYISHVEWDDADYNETR